MKALELILGLAFSMLIAVIALRLAVGMIEHQLAQLVP